MMASWLLCEPLFWLRDRQRIEDGADGIAPFLFCGEETARRREAGVLSPPFAEGAKDGSEEEGQEARIEQGSLAMLGATVGWLEE